MNCRDLEYLVPDYLSGRLVAEELREFEAHLRGCEACAREVEAAEATWATLGEFPDERPGPAMRGRFYATLEAEKRKAAVGGGRPWYRRLAVRIDGRRPRIPAFRPAWVAAAAAGFVAGVYLAPGAPPNGEIAALRAEVQEMHRTVSLSLIERDSPGERLRGVNWSARVTDPPPELLRSLASAARSDPNENVRLAAVDALFRYHDRPGVVEELARALTAESSPVVQVALIDALFAVQEKKALEALKRFVAEREAMAPVRQHAQSKLNEVL